MLDHLLFTVFLLFLVAEVDRPAGFGQQVLNVLSGRVLVQLSVDDHHHLTTDDAAKRVAEFIGFDVELGEFIELLLLLKHVQLVGDLLWVVQLQKVTDGRVLLLLQALVVARVDRMTERLAVHLVLDEVHEVGQVFVDVLQALDGARGRSGLKHFVSAFSILRAFGLKISKLKALVRLELNKTISSSLLPHP